MLKSLDPMRTSPAGTAAQDMVFDYKDVEMLSQFTSPGGKIVAGFFKTTIGKIVGVVLLIVLFPLILWIYIIEGRAEKRTLAALTRLGKVDRAFDWLTLRDRITDCYHRVNAAWQTEQMDEASEWMTSWYWQNQQLAFLNQWERDGLINHCRIKGISKIRPFHLKFENEGPNYGEGSRIVVAITAKMEDYLARRDTGKIVEGAKGYADTTHLWTFLLQNGKWVVANIEEDSAAVDYVRLPLEVPETLPAKGSASAIG